MTYIQSPLKYPVKILKKGHNHYTNGMATPGHIEQVEGLIGRCLMPGCGFTRKYPDYEKTLNNNFNPTIYAPGENHREMFVDPWRNW